MRIFASRIGFVAVFALVLFGLPIESHAQYNYTYSWSIDRFDVLLDVHEDASMTVTETISVTYDYEKRGIIRSIPVIYKDDLGNRVRIVLDVESVKRDGVNEPFVVSKSGPNKNIKIGNASVYIEGPHVYEITYTVKRAMLYFSDFDEVYWNATGDPAQTEVPIDYATVVVRLPDGTEPLQYQCYTGFFGSTEQNCTTEVAGSAVGFSAHDFLTVAVGFPKGVVQTPTIFDRVWWFVDANKAGGLPLGVLLILFLIWLRHGNDPRMKKTVIAEFEPPGELWPAYVGFMVKDKVTKHHIAAMVIQMAVKGYLRIDVDSEKPTRAAHKKAKLVKLKSSDGLDGPHKILFDAIFKSGKEIQVSKLRGKMSSSKYRGMKDGIRKKLVGLGYYHKPSFKWQSALWSIAIIFGMILFYTAALMSPIVIVTFLVAIAGSIFFAIHMPKKSHAGVEMYRQILGFKNFMHTAERYRSKWQEEKGLFAELLPYAIAFNDVDRWAQAFTGLEEQIPQWYNAPYVKSYSFTSLAGSFSSLTSTIATTAVPKSSGSSGSYRGGSFSGGGFSGGGFGGGGTSSW